MVVKNKNQGKQPSELLDKGLYELKFIHFTTKHNAKGERLQFQFKVENKPNTTLFRTFSNAVSFTNACGQFIRMLLGDNNLTREQMQDTTLLETKIEESKGNIYKAYVTQNQTLTWNNIENIQLLDKKSEER